MTDQASASQAVSEQKTTQSQGLTSKVSDRDSDRSPFLNTALAQDYLQSMHSGARWFYWIAGLSLINSIAATFGGTWSFLAGLGITQLISGFALGLSEDLGGAVNVIALILDVLVAAFFVFLGVFGSKGHTWAFIIGLVVYVLDGLIFLAFQLWLPLAFHVFVVYCLVKGLSANRNLKRLAAEWMAT